MHEQKTLLLIRHLMNILIPIVKIMNLDGRNEIRKKMPTIQLNRNMRNQLQNKYQMETAIYKIKWKKLRRHIG